VSPAAAPQVPRKPPAETPFARRQSGIAGRKGTGWLFLDQKPDKSTIHAVQAQIYLNCILTYLKYNVKYIYNIEK
jgi:hypothetical protein